MQVNLRYYNSGYFDSDFDLQSFDLGDFDLILLYSTKIRSFECKSVQCAASTVALLFSLLLSFLFLIVPGLCVDSFNRARKPSKSVHPKIGNERDLALDVFPVLHSRPIPLDVIAARL